MKHKITVEFSAPDIDTRDLEDYKLSPWIAWRYIELDEDETPNGEWMPDIISEMADSYTPVYCWDIYNTWVHILPADANNRAIEEGMVDGVVTIGRIMQMDIYLYLEGTIYELLVEWSNKFKDEIWSLYERLFEDGEPEWGDDPESYVTAVLEELKRVYASSVPDWFFERLESTPIGEDAQAAVEFVDEILTRYKAKGSELKEYKAVTAELAVLRMILDAHFVGHMDKLISQ